jgi:hypothetical protein
MKRHTIENAVDLALVGTVALWIGIAGAFLASLTPPRGEYAAARNYPPPAVSLAPSRECSDVRNNQSKAGRIPEGAFSSMLNAECGMLNDLPAGFLDRLAMVESGGDDAATNAAEGAVGRYQIRPAYLADANEAAGTSYTLAEMREPGKAEAVVHAYLGRYGRAFAARAGRAPTAEELARIHNGGPRGAESPRTLAYARAFAATEGGRP